MYNKDFLKRMALRAERDVSVVFYTRKNKTFCLSLRTGKVGIAKCHKEDKYDHFIGTGLAYCRLKNIKVPENNGYERGTIIRYNDKEYYVINVYDDYSSPSLIPVIFFDVFKINKYGLIKAGQKMTTLCFFKKLKKPKIIKKKIFIPKSPSPEVLMTYIEQMKNHQEVNIVYLPYANTIMITDLSSDLKSTIAIDYTIEDNYTLEENMAMAYCKLKGIEPYRITNVDTKDLDSNYKILKVTGNYYYCLNTITKRLETLKVVK